MLHRAHTVLWFLALVALLGPVHAQSPASIAPAPIAPAAIAPAAVAPAAIAPAPIAPAAVARTSLTTEATTALLVYFKAKPGQDPDAAFTAACAASGFHFATITKLGGPNIEQAARPVAISGIASLATYPVPDDEALTTMSDARSDAEKQELRQADSCYMMAFSASVADALACQKAVGTIAAAVCKALGGRLWDEDSQYLFTLDQWRKQRIESWTAAAPHAPDHINIHLLQKGELMRAVTFGMNKFGLADLAVDQFSRGTTKGVGWLVNSMAQALIEGQRLEADGTFLLDLEKLKDEGLRKSTLGALKANAKKQVRLAIGPAVADEANPRNILIEIAFPGAAESLQQRQGEALGALLGSEDSITYVKHDDAIRAASERAKAKLPALAERFHNGLAPRENLMVKAPFTTPSGGTEWMWVEVTRWTGETIDGVLANDPFEIPTLKAGAHVTVHQPDLFDYMLHHADGSTEGNETGELMGKKAESEK